MMEHTWDCVVNKTRTFKNIFRFFTVEFLLWRQLCTLSFFLKKKVLSICWLVDSLIQLTPTHLNWVNVRWSCRPDHVTQHANMRPASWHDLEVGTMQESQQTSDEKVCTNFWLFVQGVSVVQNERQQKMWYLWWFTVGRLSLGNSRMCFRAPLLVLKSFPVAMNG